jgi:ankyrin repeat protein
MLTIFKESERQDGKMFVLSLFLLYKLQGNRFNLLLAKGVTIMTNNNDVKKYIKQGKNPTIQIVNQGEVISTISLLDAVKQQDMNAVALLLQHGASPFQLDFEPNDEVGKTAMSYAMEQGNSTMSQFLLFPTPKPTPTPTPMPRLTPKPTPTPTPIPTPIEAKDSLGKPSSSSNLSSQEIQALCSNQAFLGTRNKSDVPISNAADSKERSADVAERPKSP